MEKLAKVSDVKNKLCVKVKDKELALFNIDGNFYCIDNKCSHVGGPLCEGELEGFNITCPWHGGEFDVRDGSVKNAPPMESVKFYKTLVKDDCIWIDL